MNKSLFKIALTLISFFSATYLIQSQTIQTEQKADSTKIDQIIKWTKDGVTTKITFAPGTYEFEVPLEIRNENLILIGNGIDNTILKLTKDKGTFINAFSNNISVKHLTIDGAFKQSKFGNALFKFNKSKDHNFFHVKFTNTHRDAINTVSGWPTEGLRVKDCVFSNIETFCIHIFNRNTNKRNGQVITSVEKIIIENTVFEEGYQNAIASDNGNDRENDGTRDADGKLIGRRFTESTSLNGTIIRNCIFKPSKQFHIGMVQTKDVIIKNNDFQGMTDDASGGSQPLHFEQFSQNIQIYNNTFSMNTTVPKAYSCIHFRGTEGHVRASQEQPSNTYTTWKYFINGGPERRADTKCSANGHKNRLCKRDVHAYGPRNIFIAGNTFNASSKFKNYVFVNEGENIQLGIRKNGTISLNDFQGDESLKKIALSGNDEGTCKVKIVKGQKVTMNNISLDDVTFDLENCIDRNPIQFISSRLFSTNNTPLSDTIPVFIPNPASERIQINLPSETYTVLISNLSGKPVKSVHKNSSSTNDYISLHGIKPGIYALILYTTGKKTIQKLIIQ